MLSIGNGIKYQETKHCLDMRTSKFILFVFSDVGNGLGLKRELEDGMFNSHRRFLQQMPLLAISHFFPQILPTEAQAFTVS